MSAKKWYSMMLCGLAAAMVLSAPAAQSAVSGVVAYDVPSATGNQSWAGALGMEFQVDFSGGIDVTNLGAFDSDGDGFVGTIDVRLYDSDQSTVLRSASFVDGTGTLIGGHRFVPVSTLHLGPGTYYIVADGFSASDPNGNTANGYLGQTTNDGGAISFTGTSRYDNAAGGFPSIVDGGPENRYVAGSFMFDSTVPVELSQFSVD